MCTSPYSKSCSNFSQELYANLVAAQLGGIALGLSIAGAVFVNGAVNGLTPVLPNQSHSQILQVVSGTTPPTQPEGDLRDPHGLKMRSVVEGHMERLCLTFKLHMVLGGTVEGGEATRFKGRKNIWLVYMYSS